MEYARRTKHLSAFVGGVAAPQEEARYRRDVSEATKYIETAVVIDKAMVSLKSSTDLLISLQGVDATVAYCMANITNWRVLNGGILV